jgi:hypothetical protein
MVYTEIFRADLSFWAIFLIAVKYTPHLEIQIYIYIYIYISWFQLCPGNIVCPHVEVLGTFLRNSRAFLNMMHTVQSAEIGNETHFSGL